MTRRGTVIALSGLLFGMFVVTLSANVVSTSLPQIIADLHGSQSSYTWMVAGTLMAMTVSLPIWGKLADLYSHKLLVQVSLIGYVVASGLAGLTQTAGQLIACRLAQGLAVGGSIALVSVIMADLISPRERGRYMGLLGAFTSAGTVGGPLVGGLITDSIGWRWNFYIGIPLAVAAVGLLQRTLHLPNPRGARFPGPHHARERVRIDLLGALLLTVSVVSLMVWLTLAGGSFAWASPQTAVLLTVWAVAGVVFVVVEQRAAEPVIPLSLFRNRTLVLAIVGSAAVGVATFASALFLAQYLQLGRGLSPTHSGLLTIPLVIGTLVASTVAGRLITRSGRWKRYVVGGGVLLPVGIGLLATIRAGTNLVLVCAFMAIVGIAVGLILQNVITVAQNALEVAHLGSGTSNVAFFRSLAGAIGLAAGSALLTARLHTLLDAGYRALALPPPTRKQAARLPDLDTLPADVRAVIETSYGQAIGDVFLAALPVMLVGLIALALLPNHPLGDKSGLELAEEAYGSAALPSDRPARIERT